jgi:glycosyltransferase involved in cell wall biosynthesis
MKITLLILALNEIEGMRAIMPQIKKEWYDQAIVIDGGSRDGSMEWARERGYQVYAQRKKGIRYAYFEILPLIEGDTVITFSPDGNSPPEAIPALIKKMRDGFDLVIASRYLAEAKSYDDDRITAFGNWLFTRTINILHKGKYTDAMVILRAFKKSLIYDLDLHREASYRLPETIFKTVISWEPLMSVRALKARMKVGEIPMDEPARIGGERKLKIVKWGLAYLFQFFYEFFFWKKSSKTNSPPFKLQTR